MRREIFSYVVEHDLGFAPNPFHNVCTLATCKPQIRAAASIGSLIVGTGTVATGLTDSVLFWMRVDELLDYDAYWRDARFQAKKPDMDAPGRLHRYGDNIYHRDEATGAWRQADSFHSDPGGVLRPKDLARDTGTTDRVLIGRSYAYYGSSARPIPGGLRDIVKTGQGHKRWFDPGFAAAFETWLAEDPQTGFIDRPSGWPPR